MKKYCSSSLLRIVASSMLLVSQSSRAKVSGIMSKSQLLAQLELGLGAKTADLRLPVPLLDRLPNTGEIEMLSASFLSAWTQVSFVGCSAIVKRDRLQERPLSEQASWLYGIAKRSWSRDPSIADIDEIVKNVTGSGQADMSKENLIALSCSAVFASPFTYLITD